MDNAARFGMDLGGDNEASTRSRASWLGLILFILVFTLASVAALALIGNPYQARLYARLSPLLSPVLGAVKSVAEHEKIDRAAQLEKAATAESRAKALIAEGDLAGARGAYEERIARLEPVAAASPEDTALQRQLYVSWMALGLIEESASNLSPARESYRKAIALLKPIADHDAANSGWQNDLEAAQERLDALDHGDTLDKAN